jgi:hypothetical protein
MYSRLFSAQWNSILEAKVKAKEEEAQIDIGLCLLFWKVAPTSFWKPLRLPGLGGDICL